MMNAEIGFGRKVLEAFEKYGISFEHMPSGVDTMTVIVHQSEIENKITDLILENDYDSYVFTVKVNDGELSVE